MALSLNLQRTSLAPSLSYPGCITDRADGRKEEKEPEAKDIKAAALRRQGCYIFPLPLVLGFHYRSFTLTRSWEGSSMVAFRTISNNLALSEGFIFDRREHKNLARLKSRICLAGGVVLQSPGEGGGISRAFPVCANPARMPIISNK